MSTPGEHKTVQARILGYAQEIGWNYVRHARRYCPSTIDTIKQRKEGGATKVVNLVKAIGKPLHSGLMNGRPDGNQKGGLR